jgi:hypothetical protein
MITNYYKCKKYTEKIKRMIGGTLMSEIYAANPVILFCTQEAILQNRFNLQFINFNSLENKKVEYLDKYIVISNFGRDFPKLYIEKSKNEYQFRMVNDIENTTFIEIFYQIPNLSHLSNPQNKYSLNYGIKFDLIGNDNRMTYEGQIFFRDSNLASCKNQNFVDDDYYEIKVSSKYNKEIRFGFIDETCNNYFNKDTISNLFKKKIFEYENDYDKLKQYVISKNKYVSNLKILKNLYNVCYNELLLESPDDILFLENNFGNIVFSMIIYKLFFEYNDSLTKIFDRRNSTFRNQILKNASKRIETQHNTFFLTINGIRRKVDLQAINNQLGPYRKKLSVIFDTGNSSTTIIGKRFLELISPLFGITYKDVIKERLKIPIGAIGVGGSASNNIYCNMQYEFDEEYPLSLKKIYDFYPLIDEKEDSTTYNMILFGHNDLEKFFKDGFCIGYNHVKPIYEEMQHKIDSNMNNIIYLDTLFAEIINKNLLVNFTDNLPTIHQILTEYNPARPSNIVDLMRDSFRENPFQNIYGVFPNRALCNSLVIFLLLILVVLFLKSMDNIHHEIYHLENQYLVNIRNIYRHIIITPGDIDNIRGRVTLSVSKIHEKIDTFTTLSAIFH